MRVRKGTAEDVEPIARLMRDMWIESRFNYMAFSDERIRHHVGFCVDRGFCMVHEAVPPYDGPPEIDAFMFGILGPTFFSDCLTVVELACYAKPGSRKFGICSVLVAEFVAWGKAMGAVECQVGSSAGINTLAVRSFYQHNGFEVVGDLMARKL